MYNEVEEMNKCDLKGQSFGAHKVVQINFMYIVVQMVQLSSVFFPLLRGFRELLVEKNEENNVKFLDLNDQANAA
jgi:hypothetical protein